MARATSLFTIDSTPWTSVVVCHRNGCDWRGFGHAKATAYRQLADHLSRCHRDAADIDDAVWRARRSAADCRNTTTNTNRRPKPDQAKSA